MLIHLIHASLIPLNPSEIHKSTFASSGVGCQTPLLTTLQRSVLYKLSCAMPQSWRVITIVLVRVLEKKNKLPELRRFSEICHRHFVTPLFLEKSTDFCTGETAPSFPFRFRDCLCTEISVLWTMRRTWCHMAAWCIPSC